MHFHGKILEVDAVLARGVEVELSQAVGRVVKLQRAVHWNLNSGAEVLKLGTIDVTVNAEGDIGPRWCRNGGVQVDR